MAQQVRTLDALAVDVGSVSGILFQGAETLTLFLHLVHINSIHAQTCIYKNSK